MEYICFLDFDGVTHPVSANERYFRAENIFPLIDCLLSPNISIVIASTWRLDMPLEEMKFNLGPLSDQVIGVTPEINDPFRHYPRQAEVELFLTQSEQDNVSWFAIDDQAAFYKPDAPLLLIDGREGFGKKDCQKLQLLLKKLKSK